MNIIKVHPQGFCKGVINAILKTNEAITNAKRPIYMLGDIVHNKNIAKTYIDNGIIIINSLDEIKSKEGSIIITAHGISQYKYNLISSTSLDIIDTTCESVKQIQSLIRQKIIEGYSVVYYGKKNHAECLGISEDYQNEGKFIVVEGEDDIEKLNISNPKLFFTNQTTMSYFETLKIIDKLKQKYPNIITKEDICNATKNRQLALIEQAQDADLIVVVGDKTSNNSLSLVDISKTIINKPCVLIENINDIKEALKEINKQRYENIAITSGASTPRIIVNNIEKALLDENHIIDIKKDEYIKIKR